MIEQASQGQLFLDVPGVWEENQSSSSREEVRDA